jgi:hypothetical protein
MIYERWRVKARSDGQTLYLTMHPTDQSELRIPWTGPATASSVEIERLTEWHVREYTSSCECKLVVYAPDDSLLGELDYTLWE